MDRTEALQATLLQTHGVYRCSAVNNCKVFIIHSYLYLASVCVCVRVYVTVVVNLVSVNTK